MGASILPVTVYNDKIMFLFGKERDMDENPGWSDFGGGTDNNETFIQTAIREGGEELTGFLGSSADIKTLLYKYGTIPIDYKSVGYSTYRTHIFPMIYDAQLPLYYNNNQKFLQQKLNPSVIHNTKIFEKTQIEWFSFDDIQKHYNTFRPFYKNIIDVILLNRYKIEEFITNSLHSPSNRKGKSKGSKSRNINKNINKNKNKNRKQTRNKKSIIQYK